MKILEFIKSQLGCEPPLNPVERVLAKRYVKSRLKAIYPHLRNNPRALEEAYHTLSIEHHPGSGAGGEALFEILFPGQTK